MFKNDYGSDVYWPSDNTDYLAKPCDVPYEKDNTTGYVLTDEEIKKEDHEFYELTDPKGCRIELYKDRKKEWRWRLFSANNKIIACSGEGYKRKGSMRKSLSIVREVISFAPVEEE